MTIRFSLDQCERQGDLLLLQGWVVSTADAQPELALCGVSPDGSPWQVRIPVNLDRNDVRARYPEAGDRDTGFFFYGRLPPGDLQGLIAREHDASPVTLADLARAPRAGWRFARPRALLALARQAMALAREGKWRLLREKVLRRVDASRAPRVNLDQAMAVQLRGLKLDTLVIDHDLGGGANLYRRRWIEQQVLDQRRVGVVVYSILRLGYVLHLHTGEGSSPIGVFSGHELAALVEALSPKRVFYNDAVSHPEALVWPQLLSDYKHRTPGCHLTLALHDFFPVCPSPHLLDADDRFCGVPEDLTRCSACLARSHQPFVDLYRHHGIGAWRSGWSALLGCADEVSSFAESGRRYLLRAYPTLDPARIALQPHAVAPLAPADVQKVSAWQSTRKASGVIAVVGSITSTAKGAGMVHALAKWLHERGAPWKVRVIGSCSPALRLGGTVYAETGPYAADTLTKHVLAQSPDLFLFPSIVPETFSFVLHEIARYGRPIAALPIGAQGDFLDRYPQSIRLPLEAQDDPAILAETLKPYLPHWITTS